MRHGKSGIKKQRGKLREKEVRIAIKQVTAENILEMNKAVTRAESALVVASKDLQNHVLPLLTEHGLKPGCRVVEVTEEEPYELVVMVPK